MTKNFFFNNIREKILILFLILFSLLINQYYGNQGIFPADSFSHFDTGFRILLDEHPFKDYWIVSGPLVDYLQGIFFYLFGINWQSYVLHASIINVILSILTFIVLKNLKLNIFYCLLYSLFFSVLAYPSSGTPFVDHHSSFFSLLGIYFLILAINNEKKIYWILCPIFLGFAFLSKQVPAFYVIVSTILIISFYSYTQKRYYWTKYFFLSTFFFILFILISGKINGILLSSFLEQYIYYPQAIGSNRFNEVGAKLINGIGNFKFIYISLLILFYCNIKKIFNTKKYLKDKKFIYFLILVLFTFCLILHQTLTRNQIFIFFLVPIIIGFLHSSFFSNKKIISAFLILFCLFITAKYHIRFNEERKFHELSYSNLKLSSNGKKIDDKFAGLRWITPEFKNNPEDEIKLINDVKKYLKNDQRKKMLMTNYSFYSVILNQSLHSPTRWHIFDGTDYPQKNSNYFHSYKNLLTNSIKQNNVKVIYTIAPVINLNIYDYISKKCFQEKKVNEILTSYEIINCKELNLN